MITWRGGQGLGQNLLLRCPLDSSQDPWDVLGGDWSRILKYCVPWFSAFMPSKRRLNGMQI